jgi:hypothetical protein
LKGWVKLYRVLLEKPIWLKSTPEQKAILVTLLLMANHEEAEWEWQGQKFKVAPGQMVTSLASIAKQSGTTVKAVRCAITKFTRFEFLFQEISKCGRVLGIVNWPMYQGENDEQGIDEGKGRAKAGQRQGKGRATNKNDKKDENDKNEKKLETPQLTATPEEEKLLAILQTVYPLLFNHNEDLLFIRKLADKFPTVNLTDEVEKWQLYLSDPKRKKPTNWRLAFRNWCENAVKFAQRDTLRRPYAEEQPPKVERQNTPADPEAVAELKRLIAKAVK